MPLSTEQTVREGTIGIREAAAFLGISRRTLETWVAEHRIEFIRVGRLVRFTKAALERFLRDHTIPPDAQIKKPDKKRGR